MLKNFTVVELLRTRSDSVVTIKKNTLRFNMPTAVELHYAPYIQVLVNAKDKQLAIKECKETDTHALKFSKPQGEQKYQLAVNHPAAADMIRKLMSWDEDMTRNVPGVYLADDRAIVYDLKSAYEPAQRGGWASRRAKEAAQDIAESNLAVADENEEQEI